MKIDLRDTNLREVQIGTIVISKKGFEFELVSRDEKGKESWKDLTSGIIWHDVEVGNFNHCQATKEFGDKLPTKEEFEIAEKHGFRDIIPNTDYFFWSGSVHPNGADFAYDFNGDNGYIAYAVRYNYVGSVRLVSR